MSYKVYKGIYEEYYYKWPKGGRYAHKIGADLTRITHEMGFVPLVDEHIKQNKGAAWYDEGLHAEVRMTAVPGSEGTGWHRDGDTSPGANMNHRLILWASDTPTLIKTPDGTVFQPLPFQLIIINNMEVLHRRPDNAPLRRWSFRQRVTL